MTQADADSAINLISTPSMYLSLLGSTTIYIRVEDSSTGNFDTTTLELNVLDDCVYIPDENFKAKLLESSSENEIAKDLNGNYFAVDQNEDGEIVLTEASVVSSLNLRNSSIAYITGINSFIGLKELDLYNNLISEFIVSELLPIEKINLSFNNVSGLIQIKDFQSLVEIDLRYNDISELRVSNINTLKILSSPHNQISQLHSIS